MSGTCFEFGSGGQVSFAFEPDKAIRISGRLCVGLSADLQVLRGVKLEQNEEEEEQKGEKKQEEEEKEEEEKG